MQHLRKIISGYMYRIAGVLVLATFAMILAFQLTNKQMQAYNNANRTFLQMEQVLTENKEELVKIKKEYEQSCLHAAQAVSRIVEGDPEALHSSDKLKEIAAEVEVDEIHIFNKDGQIFAGTLPQYYGYTVDSGEQMHFFKPMLADTSLKMVQDITENTAEGKLMQYSAVWSKGGEFIVQVGMNPVNVIKATEKNELSHIFSLLRVNPNINYYAIDRDSGIIIGSNNLKVVGNACSAIGFHFEDIKENQKWFYNKVNGRHSFCVFQKIGPNYIGQVIPVRYLYQGVLLTMAVFLICMSIVALILVVSVTKYMNTYVVDKIHDVIQKLELIAKGDLEARVDIQSSLEFHELSNYINQMVQSLLNINHIEQHANETLRIALQAADPEKSLKIVLECLGKSLDGERSYIFEKNRQDGDDNTYEWVADGVTPEKDNLQNLSPEICRNWYGRFRENKCIVFENIEDMREQDPLQYDNLKKQNIVSIVVVPLYDNGKALGFYGVDNPPVQTLKHTINMLRIMGYFIESLIRVRNLVRNLKQMSYSDHLTQIGNRHALREYIDNMDQNDSIGIVYCDITGLKRVNDEKGHEAGDRLILSACECMKKTLDGYALFRLGGDELLAVCNGISEMESWKKVKNLKEKMSEYDVVMAVGAVWKSNAAEGGSNIIAEAETLMYKDKAAYYAASGIERRK